MDDNLGQPTFPVSRDATTEEGNEESSGEEDDGPDWTKLPSSISASRPSLPKRGDKEFEPAADGPTNLQAHSLNRAREAMFGALGAERGISNKSISYAVWYPALARAHVTQARGVHFNGMGHSAGRPAPGSGDPDAARPKIHRRTELLPEETLYLIERGSLFCWRDEPGTRHSVQNNEQELDVEDPPGEHDMRGSPMSVQQAFVEMVGRDDLTLERYHAFACLKRLGFNVLRTKPPSPSYPIPPVVTRQESRPSLLARLFYPSLTLFSRLGRTLSGGINWWKPLSFGIWSGCARNYTSLYRSLRFIPSGHNAPLHVESSTSKPPEPPNGTVDEQPTPYEIFYNVYKPNTPFRKSAPPAPDFSLVVVNARTTPLPTIHELTYLWSSLPETGPPPPRQRNRAKVPQNPSTTPVRLPPPPSAPSMPSRFVSWLFGRKSRDAGPPPRKPHPFAVLKAGKKTVVVGVVDSGTVGFFRFGMGAFEEMPMV